MSRMAQVDEYRERFSFVLRCITIYDRANVVMDGGIHMAMASCQLRIMFSLNFKLTRCSLES